MVSAVSSTPAFRVSPPAVVSSKVRIEVSVGASGAAVTMKLTVAVATL